MTRSRIAALTLLTILALGGLVACRPRPAPPAADVAAVVILTAEDGITAVSQGELRAIGFQTENFAPSNMRLTRDGADVPYLIDGERLLFYGQAPVSRTAAVTAYILERGQPGTILSPAPVEAPATSLESVQATVLLEQNNLYAPEARSADDVEPWFWRAINQGTTADVTANLPNVADGGGELEVALWGFTEALAVSDDHDLVVVVNGRPAGRIVWDGRVYHSATLPLPPGMLRRGDNTITLDNSAAGAVPLDIIYLDRLALRYNTPPVAVDGRLSFTGAGGQVTLEEFDSAPLVLDVTDPGAPSRLPVGSGGTLAVRSGASVAAADAKGYLQPVAVRPRQVAAWLSPEEGADLVIVAAGALAPALQPLVEARRAEGLAARVVLAEEIGDALGGGVLTPEAINRFVAHILTAWPEPRPRYLLLVGDATLDYRGYANSIPPDTVPTALVATVFGGETASDAPLADADGDGRADVAVGRWPVSSREEVAALVDRTLAYERGPAARRALFAADASETGFAALAGRLAEVGDWPPGATVQLTGPTPAEMLAEWNNDVWLATYVGHGSLDRWGKDALLTAADVARVAPSAAGAPIVLEWTCLSGLFAQPQQESLSETLLRHPRGPVLVVGPTSLTLSTHQEPFAMALTGALTDPGLPRAGDALLAAAASLDPADPAQREIRDTFVLFGDPSARIVRP